MNASELLLILSTHRGRANGISGDALAARCDVPARRVRELISEMRFEGVAIVGTPATGYYVAEAPEEIKEFEDFHFARARHSLGIISRVRGVSMPILLGQLSLNQA